MDESWWSTSFKGIVPTDYLYENAYTATDKEIAEALSEITGLHVTRNSVKLKRRREGIRKGDGKRKPEPKPEQPREHLQFEQTGHNTARASSVSHRIRTLDQLLEACAADLDVWRIAKWGAKSWEGYAKRERTHLEYQSGSATGVLEKGGIEVETLWSVWADFLRAEPQKVFPTIQPVRPGNKLEPPALPTEKPLLRSVLWGDAQVGFRKALDNAKLDPFHDMRAIDVLLQIIAAAQPDRVDGAGDNLDLPEWSSKFLVAPEFYWTTQPSLFVLYWILRQIREAVPDAEINLHEGNHEKRMADAVKQHLRAAYDLKPAHLPDAMPVMSVPFLLGLDQLGIKWHGDYPDDDGALNDGIMVAHGNVARKSGAMRADSENRAITRIVFHNHRQEQWTRTIQLPGGERSYVTSFCPGCLCRIDGAVPGAKKAEQWQQGIAIVDYEPDGALFSIAPVLIHEGRAAWNGQVFEGKDRTDEIREMFPDWNW